VRLIAALLVVAALAVPAAARADGDPASDWLLTQATFVPQDDGVPTAYAQQLQAVVADAKARGYVIRVALIGTEYDMGSVYSRWRQPQPYARFLGQELYFVYKKRLLVVMPNGLAVTNGGKVDPTEQAVVDRIPPPAANHAALASAATNAVIKLAANAGIVVTTPTLGKTTSGTSENQDRVVIAAVALVVAALLVAGGFLRKRRKAAVR
jgi:hypothetical protein